MSLHNVTPGAKAPDEFNVIVEIPMNADPIKYEVDEASGAIFVDRFMGTAMHYPCNYGYIPQTLADDGDPVDVLGPDGTVVARALAGYDAAEARTIMGHRSDRIAGLLGYPGRAALVHRDDMAL